MRKERQLAGSTRRKSVLPKPFAGTGENALLKEKATGTATNAAKQKISTS